jgi:hypothetical protein
MTSHAAVVARGMGKPCVSGAGQIRVDYASQTLTVAGQTLKKGTDDEVAIIEALQDRVFDQLVIAAILPAARERALPMRMAHQVLAGRNLHAPAGERRRTHLVHGHTQIARTRMPHAPARSLANSE